MGDAGRQAVIRLVNGFVQPVGDALVAIDPLPVAGDVVLCANNQWTRGEEADWHPQLEVGIVQLLSGGRAVVSAALGQKNLAVPSGMELAPGNTVEFDAREEVLRVIAPTPVEPEPVRIDRGDDFDPGKLLTAVDDALSWEQFAGFDWIRAEAQDIVRVQMQHAARQKLRDLRVRPIRGILFEGPPGTGKTMLAQIMAKEAGAAFYMVTAASLGGHLQGESEGRLEAIYEHASTHEVALVFIDEIDTLMKDRGSDNDYGSRLVHVFLTNLDGAGNRDNVITIGTTNRVHDIDPALRRTGRFSRELRFERPDEAGRLAILQGGNHHTAGRLDYEHVAAATADWSAADLQGVWEHAGELTVKAGRTAIRNDFFLAGFDHARERKARQNGHTA
ncbi:transitional endoplasmic reticulum ATPase [Plantibacter flavus]|uniref:Transitional endoplasmic reticulum ATPase n=2 Tax=Plantibacter flavus TaxID=150123 RepID=A0A3N2BXQ9_9MICO|nr:transitional endoplasmic reticulum ATPase [Plantibacter flavus]SMG28802.1 transitional endoplasmic reticulum ATPase [Plantibacter flavus]